MYQRICSYAFIFYEYSLHYDTYKSVKIRVLPVGVVVGRVLVLKQAAR